MIWGVWVAAALLILAPVALLVWFALEGVWHGTSSEESEREARARTVVTSGAALVGFVLLFSASVFLRPETAPGLWNRGSEGAIAWLILLLGLGLPYVTLAVRLARGRPPAELLGMALVLGWLPLCLAGLALSWILIGPYSGAGIFALGFVLVVLGPPTWLAVATRDLVRVPSVDGPRRMSGARATAVWTVGIVAAALTMGAWDPEYRPPTPPADRRLPAEAPTAIIAWTAGVEGSICNPPSLPPAVDESGTVYAAVRDRLVAVSGEGDVLWEQVELRPMRPPLPRPGGGAYVVAGGWTGRQGDMGERRLVEVLPDGSVAETWPYVETPLPRAEGGFYSLTWDALVAVAPDGREEWRTPIPRSGPLGRPFQDTLGNVLVPDQWDDRIYVVEPDGDVKGTLSGLGTDPRESWIPGPYPASALGGRLIFWDGIKLVALAAPGDTFWRRQGYDTRYGPGYEGRVAVAPDGSLRAIYRNDGVEVFLVRLDSLGLPKWRQALAARGERGSTHVWAGPVVAEDGASLVIVEGRAIAVEGDGSLRWISESLPGTTVTHAAAWGPDGRAYVVRQGGGRGRCAVVVALEPPGSGRQAASN